MHFSTGLAAILASAPMLVSAGGALGWCLGAGNPDGSCKAQSDYEADFQAIEANSGSKLVRIYAASQCNTAENILPAAKAQGFQVLLGIWPDTEKSYDADKAACVKYAPQYADQVYGITVGSEALYRGSFTGEQLLAKIQDIKSALPQFKVGTADSWNKYQDGTADPIIAAGVDILLCNAFSYWQGQAINNATGSFMDDVMQSFGRIQSVSNSTDKIEMWVGETGWTTSSGTYGQAVPSVANAEVFYSNGICGMLDWGFNVFYFEAFDEPGKPTSIGQNGEAEDETHWGAMTVNRTAKYPLKC